MKTLYIKKIFFSLLIFSCSILSFAQNKTDDNKLLQDVIPSVFARIFERDSYLEEKPCQFFNKKEFFTHENFMRYTKLMITNNKEQVKRVKKLMKKIDFQYLLNYKPDTLNWNLSNVKYEKLVGADKSKSYYEIAKPIYSKDGKYAFLYFQYNCGYPSCVDYGVKIFKRCRNKWKFYINMVP